MKIIRFVDAAGQTHLGIPHDDSYAELLGGDLWQGLSRTGEILEISRLLAPLDPKQILCIGLNYREHALETGAKIPEYPVLFMKTLNAVQDPGGPVVLPRHLRSDEVDYEVELAVVIGKPARNVSRLHALDYVLGYTAAIDVSARDWQKQRSGTQWCRAKSFDTFCPLGPCLVTTEDLGNAADLRLTTEVNGVRLQDARTSDMIFDVPALIEFLSGDTTLLPGTVILTGTPHGVGMSRQPPVWLQDGDTLSVTIEGIGTLTHRVVAGSDVPG
ncbi:MAG: fumarylacetoacetate hydrolase family protein [Candidatus Methylacidiphilales bacterium]